MQPKKPGPREPSAGWRYDALAYTFAGSIMLFAGLGYLLDRWLGTRPLLIIAGTLVGAALAIVWVYAKVREDERASAERRHRSGPGGQ